MINTKYLLCISTCLLLSNDIQATEINLTYNLSLALPDSLVHTHIHTPSTLKPIPLFNAKNAVKLASVCSVNGGGSCGILNFNSMDLDSNAQCKDEGYVNTCPDGYVKDESDLCPYNKSYFKCREADNSCDEGYSTTTCQNTSQTLVDSYQNESGTTCYKCRDKTCTEGGYADSLTACQTGTSISFANQTCYQDISTKSCEDGGYISSVPANNKCDSAPYCNKTCYTNCKQPTCEESGFLTACPSNHTCDTVTTNTYGRTCYKDEGQPTCEDAGYKSGVPTNQVCSSVSYSGRTCYKDCYQPTCSKGGYVDTVPTNNKCTAVSYYGRTCQKDCKQPTCSDGGYVDAQPDGQTCTKTAYYGQTCYSNCSNTQCTVSNCKECVSGSTTDCKICDDGYRLASDEAGSYCADDTYQTCCNNGNSLSGRYDKTTDKFERCYTNPDTAICANYCITPPCSSFTGTYSTQRYSVGTCDELKFEALQLDREKYFMNGGTFVSIEKDLDCSSMDLDYTNSVDHVSIFLPAYHSGSTPSNVSLEPGETLKESNQVYKLKVKSFSSPYVTSSGAEDSRGASFSNIELTATDKAVLRDVALSNSTVIAPKIYLAGTLGLKSSKLIADDIYIASGTSIVFGISNQKITAYWSMHNGIITKSYQCTSSINDLADTSFIGSPERAVAFHFDPNANKEEFEYGAIANGSSNHENVKIYGYNVESSPLFSELHFNNGSYYMTSTTIPTFSVTISDMLGKGKSNLFYRLQTLDHNKSTDAFYNGYLIYEGQQQLCKQMKENAYLTPLSGIPSCTLQNAEHMVTCNSTDYDNATCKLFGKLDKSDPNVNDYLSLCANPTPDYEEYCKNDISVVCEKDDALYQQSGGKLDCYTCVINNCIDPYWNEDLGENNAECSYGMQDKIVADYDSEFQDDKSTPPSLWPAAQCVLAQPNESAEDACERVRDKWLNQDGTNPKTITPLHSYDANGGKCVLCKLSFH